MLHDANAVRPDRDHRKVVVEFPLERSRPSPMRRDEVVVRNAGETRIFASFDALAAAVREDDPILQAQLAELNWCTARARDLVAAAEARERAAGELEAAAAARETAAAAAEASLRAYTSKLKLAAFVGGAIALFAVVFGL